MSDQQQFDVFISHSHDDAVIVEQLANLLVDNHGFQVWLDRWVLVPGGQWQQDIARGLSQAKTCVICIGSETPSGWFELEIQRALNRRAEDPNFRVIPVLLPNAQEVNVNDFLELNTWVDLKKGLNDVWSFHMLVSGIKGVPPGRPPGDEVGNGPTEQDTAKEKLRLLRDLRSEGLVDDTIAREYQVRYLDVILGP